jgi:hypothetical protein
MNPNDDLHKTPEPDVVKASWRRLQPRPIRGDDNEDQG